MAGVGCSAARRPSPRRAAATEAPLAQVEGPRGAHLQHGDRRKQRFNKRRGNEVLGKHRPPDPMGVSSTARHARRLRARRADECTFHPGRAAAVGQRRLGELADSRQPGPSRGVALGTGEQTEGEAITSDEDLHRLEQQVAASVSGWSSSSNGAIGCAPACAACSRLASGGRRNAHWRARTTRQRARHGPR